MKQEVPLFKSFWGEDDVNAVAEVIRRGNFWATGPEIQTFEEHLATYIGTQYAVAYNSGTSALHAVLLAHGITSGDEVIVPSFTFIATANAPLFVGAKPVFAEIEDTTFGLDLEDVKNRISSKTKAIMPIHYGGCSCLNIEAFKDIAEDHNLLLIEDAAQSLGAKIKQKKVGTYGDSAMFSFCQDKITSTGEGGAIVTSSKDIYNKLKLIRSHGREENSTNSSTSLHLDYTHLGYNFRMPTMVAALGISQLKKVNKAIKLRRKNASIYTSKLANIKELTLSHFPKDFFHVYQKYTIQIEGDQRDALLSFLRNKEITSRAYFGKPVHLTQFYKEKFGYKKGDLPNTEAIANRILSLPIYPTLTESELIYVVDSIKSFFKG